MPSIVRGLAGRSAHGQQASWPLPLGPHLACPSQLLASPAPARAALSVKLHMSLCSSGLRWLAAERLMQLCPAGPAAPLLSLLCPCCRTCLWTAGWPRTQWRQ